MSCNRVETLCVVDEKNARLGQGEGDIKRKEEGRGEQRRVYGKEQPRKGFSYMDFLRWYSFNFKRTLTFHVAGSVNVTWPRNKNSKVSFEQLIDRFFIFYIYIFFFSCFKEIVHVSSINRHTRMLIFPLLFFSLHWLGARLSPF